MDAQLRMLGAMSSAELRQTMAGFDAIPLSSQLAAMPWAAQPGEFVEQMTAYLWTVHAIDAFHQAALAYGKRLHEAMSAEDADKPRFCAVVIGRGARGGNRRLFEYLRPHGTLFTQVDRGDGLSYLLAAVQARVQAQPASYAHWYVDGAAVQAPVEANASSLVTLSYDGLGPLRASLLRRMQSERTSANVGPEQLRSLLAEFGPGQFHGVDLGGDEILRRFQISLLTEGSGTQIFSTTFVQWAGREILRRARPQTLLLRYAPRQIDQPMNDLLLASTAPPAEDAEGSLVDADMGAYYTWINLSRLSSASQATFLAWFEEGTEVMVIAPQMPRATVSTQACNMKQILHWLA